MKKFAALFLSLLCVAALALMSGRLLPETAPQVLEAPPALMVSAGEARVQAWRGTYSWRVDDTGGRGRGVASDSVHPLEAGAMMTPLAVGDAETATLDFVTAPDAVSARAWDAALLMPGRQKTDPEPAEITQEDDAQAVAVAVTGSAEEGWQLTLLPYEAVYEISADWTSAADYGGSATYAFYTSEK